mmetsp:Transcript_36374/g.72395  ORF Transcript_36374/g.72395 Transcript_36374/m.72395 type:complete len:152 (+) Transcript_36374:406-861(+)
MCFSTGMPRSPGSTVDTSASPSCAYIGAVRAGVCLIGSRAFMTKNWSERATLHIRAPSGMSGKQRRNWPRGVNSTTWWLNACMHQSINQSSERARKNSKTWWLNACINQSINRVSKLASISRLLVQLSITHSINHALKQVVEVVWEAWVRP